MSDFIETPTIGEILSEEFLIPLGISAYKLAQEINVPTSRIQDILHNRRKITVDTSLRLAKFFGLSDGYFMALQDDIDIRNAKISTRVIAVFHNILEHTFDGGNWDRKANTVAIGRYSRIDADNFACGIYEWTARVAWVNSCISLDHVG